MIDTLKYNLDRAVSAAESLSTVGMVLDPEKGFGLVTLHRPSNVDDSQTLERLISVLGKISEQTPLVFPMHPRTQAQVALHGLEHLLESFDITIIPPQGYLEMLGLMRDAKVVLTDSGGIQEETTALGVPCITLRENTERPITVHQGTNTIVGTDVDKIRASYADVLTTGGKAGRVPELWDGKAAERIVAIISDWLSEAG